MTYALNELDGLLKKASIGAGLPVGQAIAIAAAGVWLARRGFPACEIVARAVADGMRASQVARDGASTTFLEARAGIDGPAAIDLLLAGDGETVALCDVDEPALMLGLAGAAAETNGVGFVFEEGGDAVVIGDGAAIVAADWGRRGARRFTLRLRRDVAGHTGDGSVTRYDPVTCGDGGWGQLAALAHKTYVPASDRSRLSGAGAGLTDND